MKEENKFMSILNKYGEWIRYSIIVFLVFGNLYLQYNFTTKSEFEEHLKEDKAAHLLINDKLNLLIEYNVKQNNILTKLDDHEIRIRLLEKVAAQNHPLTSK